MPPTPSLLDQIHAATSAADVTRAFLSPAGLAASATEVCKAIETARAFEDGMLWGLVRDPNMLPVLDRSVGLSPGQRDALRASMTAVLSRPATSKQREHALYVLQTLTPSVAAQMAEHADLSALWADCLPKRATTALTTRHRRNIAGLLTMPTGVTAMHLRTVVARDFGGMGAHAAEILAHRACDHTVIAAVLEQLAAQIPVARGPGHGGRPALREWHAWYLGLWTHRAFTASAAQRAVWWRIAATRAAVTADVWHAVLLAGSQPDARVAAHALDACWPNGLTSALRAASPTQRSVCARALDRSLIERCVQSPDAEIRQIGVMAIDTASDDVLDWPPATDLGDPRCWPAIVVALGAKSTWLAEWCRGQVNARLTPSLGRYGAPPITVEREQEVRRDVAIVATLDTTQPLGEGALQQLIAACGDDMRLAAEGALKTLRVEIRCQRAAAALAETLAAAPPLVSRSEPGAIDSGAGQSSVAQRR